MFKNLTVPQEVFKKADDIKDEIYSKNKDRLKPLGGRNAATYPALLAASRRCNKPIPPKTIADYSGVHTRQTLLELQPEPEPEPRHYINYHTPKLDHPVTQKELRKHFRTGSTQISQTYKRIMMQKIGMTKKPTEPEITKKTFDYFGHDIKDFAHHINQNSELLCVQNKLKAAASIYIASKIIR
jgi:hypothetical protein